MLKLKNKKLILGILLCICLAVCVVFSFSKTTSAQAYNSTNMPTGENVIDNIVSFDGDGKASFNNTNLNKLAKIVKYNTIKKLAEAAVEDSFKPLTSADFGDIVVKFGEYEFNGTKHELTWIPVYVSNSEDNAGNKSAILTLWLATNGTQGTESYQEESTWSNGTTSTNATGKSYHGSTIYSNTYDGSYIRNYVLNGSTDYTTAWGSGTPVTPPAADTMTKFSSFVGNGELAGYIVEPKYVSWQANANYMKNDPGWNPASSTKGKGVNYPSEWTGDKLWLPSVYEMVYSNMPENSKSDPSGTADGGLWKTTKDKRSCASSKYVWIRSGDPGYYNFACLTEGGYHAVTNTCGVRPALHLNISMMSGCEHNLVNKPAVSYCDKDGYEEYWECSKCGSLFSDSAAKTEIKTPVVVAPTGHSTTYNAANLPTCVTPGNVAYYNCSKCGKNFDDSVGTNELTTTVDPATGVHSYTVYTSNGNATCINDGTKTATCDHCTQTNTIPDTGSATGIHSFTSYTSDGNATCTADGTKTAHCNTSGCTATDTVTDTGTMLPHSFTTYISDGDETCLVDGHETAKCDNCTATDKRVAVGSAPGHDFSITVSGTPPTCQKGGSATMKCSRCTETETKTSSGPVGHSYTTYTSNGNATCTADGTKTAHCDFGCGTDDTVTDTGTMLPHSYTTYTSDGNATCNSDGTKTATCDYGCGAKDTVDDAGTQLTHSFTNYVSDGNATYTADGTETAHCDHGCGATDTRTEVGSMLDKNPNTVTITVTDFAYGDSYTPTATATYGTPDLTYSDTLGGTYTATIPVNAGTYYVKATVAEGADYLAAEVIEQFDILPREITVTINPASSVADDPLEALSASVTVGNIVGGDSPYTLSTDADITTMGTYTITGVCTDTNYNITFEDAVYIVSKKVEDDDGSIDLPVDIDVVFKVTQSQTDSDYSSLAGMKYGYWAQLWNRNPDGTLGDEFTGTMNCILTLKIPTEIIEAIRGGEAINRDKIAEALNVYYVDGDGDFIKVKAFTIAQKEDESWIVKFNYNEKFRAEVVFSASGVEQSEPEKAGIPWWVWVIIGIGGATLLAIIIVIIVVAKKKKGDNTPPDNGELLSRMDSQEQKIDELLTRSDDG
ncbi:MAG: hypothetical protein K2O67_05610, partial [Clostridia bacterium]|nr:hypothetical protein [Clostridia bacterium]